MMTIKANKEGWLQQNRQCQLSFLFKRDVCV